MASKTTYTIAAAAIIIISFIFSYFIYPTYIEIIIGKFAQTKYVNNYAETNGLKGILLFLLAYSIVSFYLNTITLKMIGRLTVFRLCVQGIIDQLAIPVSIYLMVVYNNTKLGLPDMTSLLNPFCIAIVLLFKHAILYLWNKNGPQAEKN